MHTEKYQRLPPSKSRLFDKKIALKTPNQDTYTQSLDKFHPSETQSKGKTCSATRYQVETQEKVPFRPVSITTTAVPRHLLKIDDDNPNCEYLTDNSALTEDHIDTLKMDN